ncbi:pep-carboxykinase i [Babesia caballi]|uniref:phosphoenolpyruvate carboxykinase (ATP) n=1 Tax=Babesia caballi TaxID=5871 RepID=A0AAV4LXU6_BABCB|nr:pep-carboxykinase i [Babesia caballi]
MTQLNASASAREGVGTDASNVPSQPTVPLNLESHLMPTSPLMSRMDEGAIISLSQNIFHTKCTQQITGYGIKVPTIFLNASTAVLTHNALLYEPNTVLNTTGALCCKSGEKTGRSPADKRTVAEDVSKSHVWWGKVNIELSESSYAVNRERAIDYINLQQRIYVTDAYAGWDPEHRIRVRIISTRAYHALFMKNLLIEPTAEELRSFEPDFVLYNAGAFPCNRYTEGVSSSTSICLSYKRMEMVILGSEYAGEMKKGIFTLMMYLMPLKGLLPLHSSCNVGTSGDVTLFFGLSGTGKTTLSADPARKLVGDDEHVWTDKGVFNIEGGCYAKCKDLCREKEPEIFDAIKFGAVVENVVYDPVTHEIDYTDCTITENTRCAYPLQHISNVMIPAKVDVHPSNIIFLTCDAFGVIPPVSKLTTEQAMYHFVSGYTSKMVGTEMGVTRPTATFSACYAEPFLAMHPMVYAKLLEQKLLKHKTDIWLLNTGWIQGTIDSEKGRRIPLRYTRAIVDAIHSGALKDVRCQPMAVFGLMVPVAVEGVPAEVLDQRLGWGSADYDAQVEELAQKFAENFKQYQSEANESILRGGPELVAQVGAPPLRQLARPVEAAGGSEVEAPDVQLLVVGALPHQVARGHHEAEHEARAAPLQPEVERPGELRGHGVAVLQPLVQRLHGRLVGALEAVLLHAKHLDRAVAVARIVRDYHPELGAAGEDQAAGLRHGTRGLDVLEPGAAGGVVPQGDLADLLEQAPLLSGDDDGGGAGGKVGSQLERLLHAELANGEKPPSTSAQRPQVDRDERVLLPVVLDHVLMFGGDGGHLVL